MSKIFPLCQEINYCDPADIFSAWCNKIGAIFLDSAKISDNLSRYSFIAVDPFHILTSKNGKNYIDSQLLNGNPFDILSAYCQKYELATHPNKPPFQGGMAGFFGYELNQHLEMLPKAKQDDLQCPDLFIGCYDLVIAFDHQQQQAFIFSSGLPKLESNERNAYAKTRLQWLLQQLKPLGQKSFHHHALCEPQHIRSNFTESDYRAAIKKTIDYIYAGDIFEANIAQRFSVRLAEKTHPFSIYQRLRAINPAPFAAYVNCGDTILVSASPERFLHVDGRQVETRPIKGTRPRGKTAAEDLNLYQELATSEKDQAENVMIVDLMRNDLSRVCKPGTVQVPQLCQVESFETVHHLVSVVTAELLPGKTLIDLLKATFPGGSITGAPKIRAMEIIAEIEPHARGPYCGSIAYLGFDGRMDSSIIIRTVVIKDQIITFHAGGAVTADSNPQEEYQETLDKASALKRTLLEKCILPRGK